MLAEILGVESRSLRHPAIKLASPTGATSATYKFVGTAYFSLFISNPHHGFSSMLRQLCPFCTTWLGYQAWQGKKKCTGLN